jgi:hypothetical protein
MGIGLGPQRTLLSDRRLTAKLHEAQFYFVEFTLITRESARVFMCVCVCVCVCAECLGKYLELRSMKWDRNLG